MTAKLKKGMKGFDKDKPWIGGPAVSALQRQKS